MLLHSFLYFLYSPLLVSSQSFVLVLSLITSYLSSRLLVIFLFLLFLFWPIRVKFSKYSFLVMYLKDVNYLFLIVSNNSSVVPILKTFLIGHMLYLWCFQYLSIEPHLLLQLFSFVMELSSIHCGMIVLNSFLQFCFFFFFFFVRYFLFDPCPISEYTNFRSYASSDFCAAFSVIYYQTTLLNYLICLIFTSPICKLHLEMTLVSSHVWLLQKRDASGDVIHCVKVLYIISWL